MHKTMPLRYWTLIFCWLSLSCTRTSQKLPPADLSSIDPAAFTEDELDLPYYLAHFHRLANAVVLEGENRGFIDIPVWRREGDNEPYNARIMENILSLAYFYANDRPWNPYFGSPQLRVRLEAALEFWCNIQSPEGKFSEYGPGEWNLAATAFATKFMGESLQWLKKGPPIDADLLERVIAADRKAIHFVLTDSSFYDFGTRYSNQFSNVWAGALAYLDLHPDEEIRNLLRQRLEQSMTDFQSAAGYFYEANGPDWSYNLGTHHSNLHMAFHYAQDPALREMLGEKDRAFSEWLGYNSVPEPAAFEFVLNRGVECRQSFPAFERYGWFLSQGMPLTQVDPLSHAFVLDQAEVQQVIKETREELLREWPKVDSLPVGEFHAFSPYAFLYRRHDRYYPTPDERRQAMDQLPVNRPPFVHQRYDVRNETVYTFVRTPVYYAAFNSGRQVRPQQRFGLGLIWTPAAGALLQSQTRQIAEAWGTRIQPDSLPYEAADLETTFLSNNEPVGVVAGNRDLPVERLTARYSLGNAGAKKLEFLPDRIRVTATHPGVFFEYLPLLVEPGQLPDLQSGLVKLSPTVRVIFSAKQTPALTETELSAGHKKVVLLQLTAENELTYEILF